MFSIITRYTTTATGQGRILAKGKGKQFTLPYDHSKSIGWNHGTAAAHLLMDRLGWSVITPEEFGALGVAYMGFADGTHRFNFPS